MSNVAAEISSQISSSYGITADLRIGLSQDELFAAALEGDKAADGSPKAFQTALGVDGPLVYYSDPDCTGRPVNDTFGVDRPEVSDTLWWKPGFGKVAPEAADKLLEDVVAHINTSGNSLYVTDLFCGWDTDFAEPYRFIGEYATHAYFCNIMFPANIKEDVDRVADGWTMINIPSFKVEDPALYGLRSNRGVVMDVARRTAIVVGPADYCGINKKTMFTVMNYVLPAKGQLTMHCSANVGQDNESAILFGLSGTGKTTLSADPDRLLIGDDEHVWSDSGVANFENGCYAKLIDLNKDNEPVIAAALSMKGTLIENVPPVPGKALEETDPQELDLSDNSVTENTRFAYGLDCNPSVAEGAQGPHPSTIVLLTADAFGVLPPVSILSPEEVMYHFVMGFTSKLAGTEVGVTEPKAAFSACFGEPFMSQRPEVYAKLLAKRMEDHNTRCILLNTGWSGGGYGVGERMSLPVTRRLLNAALAGELDNADVETHEQTGLTIPTAVDGVDSTILNPRSAWEDPDAYDEAAAKLKALFQEHWNNSDYASLGIEPKM